MCDEWRSAALNGTTYAQEPANPINDRPSVEWGAMSSGKAIPRICWWEGNGRVPGSFEIEVTTSTLLLASMSCSGKNQLPWTPRQRTLDFHQCLRYGCSFVIIGSLLACKKTSTKVVRSSVHGILSKWTHTSLSFKLQSNIAIIGNRPSTVGSHEIGKEVDEVSRIHDATRDIRCWHMDPPPIAHMSQNLGPQNRNYLQKFWCIKKFIHILLQKNT